MKSASIIHLPYALLLLVHLHILEYPHVNGPEYDHDMFNARTRRLRERAKTMEDIAHYMVGRLEGPRGVKSILATYPCHQPAESLAFRTSLAKYLEALRQKCVYPKGNAVPELAAWWKDVVVRRSLLQECAGDKFERLMLSLSTHVLMRASRALEPAVMGELLRTEPLAYTNSLKRYQATWKAWSKSASLLLRIQVDFRVLRDRLQAEGATPPTKYCAIPTTRLKALVYAAFQELLKQRWAEDCSKHALDLIMELAGFNLSSSLPTLPAGSRDYGFRTSSSAPLFPSTSTIAAVHHPAYLKRLRRSVLQKKVNQTDALFSLRAYSEIVIENHLDIEKQMHRTLGDALAKLKRRCSEALVKVEALANASEVNALLDDPSFWTVKREHMTPFNFAPHMNKVLITALVPEDDFTNPDPEKNEMDKKIRKEVLPPYLPVFGISAPQLPPRYFQAVITKKKRLPDSRFENSTAVVESEQSALPIPPAMSLGKSAGGIYLMSTQFPISSRPSMFRIFSGQVNDEVDRLVDETHDFPTDDEDAEDEYSLLFMTPKGQGRPKINRIWTAGTPASAMKNAAKAKQSAADMALRLDRSSAPRPPVISPLSSSASMYASLSDSGAHSDEDNSGVPSLPTKETPRPLRYGRQGHRSSEVARGDEIFGKGRHAGEKEVEGDADSDEFYDDPPSLTLQEILLSADTSHFNLLEMADDDIEGGALTTDGPILGME